MYDKDRSMKAFLNLLNNLNQGREVEALEVYAKDGSRIKLEVKADETCERKIRLVREDD